LFVRTIEGRCGKCSHRYVASVHTGHIYILPNGIPESRIESSKIENHQPVIVFLSNLKKDKGIEVFLNSLLQIQKKKIPFKARIVGDEYDFTFQDAKEFVESNGMQGLVEVMGPRFGNEKLQILKSSDIFVLPSMNECFPLAILEAMQEGLPVISTVIGGIPDMIENGKQGLLVQPGEVDDLAKKLELLLMEPAKRKALGQNAKAKFESSYTIEKFNLGLAGIFEKVNAQ
jgi:glycosyltransferase involved in cell wall biosynthesis